MSGAIFVCHIEGAGEVATGISWEESKDTAKHPPMYRMDPTVEM